jgi:hypothetical protein
MVIADVTSIGNVVASVPAGVVASSVSI